MKLTKNVKALSKLSFIILLIASLIIGALLSYLWVIGYYLTLGIRIPASAALSISDVVFPSQNASYFNVTFFNPSYSSAANITGIVVKTARNDLYNITQSFPKIPYSIPKASNTFSGKVTFQCPWDWTYYTNQTIAVIAFLDDGSGPTYKTDTPPLSLKITEVRFNSSISITHFNLTIQNSQKSATYVNISQILLPIGEVPSDRIFPPLPYKLDPNKTETFICQWNWTNFQNQSMNIVVQTVQGYKASYNATTPLLGVEIADVIFSESDTNHFNVTIRNKEESPGFVNINRIAVTCENGTLREIDGTLITPDALPYKLEQNSTKTFTCPWNWTHYRGKDVLVSIFTAQNYTIRYAKATPPPIEVISAIFNPADTNSFNVTVHNSAFYYSSVNITKISLTFENGTVKEINGTTVAPQLPYVLAQDSSATFRALWNWANYQGKNVTITVGTAENYTAQLVKVTPKRVFLTIASISFDSVDTSVFNVMVRNSALSLESASITRVTVTFENGTVREVSNVVPSLPYLLSPNSTTTFTCQWDWTSYRGKNITITIYTEKGYATSSLYTTPPLQ